MTKMPVLFIGHGSPINAIEDNKYTREWKDIALRIPRPAAILSVSAHWFTIGTRVMDNAYPQMIYDIYGFPPELYEVVYPAPGAPELAKQANRLLGGISQMDRGWGFDHGTWSVLHVMFPAAEIPIFQVSVDQNASPETHYEIGKRLAPLRELDVLILGSGNVVHNLGLVDFERNGGYRWAEEFDRFIVDAIRSGDHSKVLEYLQAGESARKSVPTLDHFAPLLTALGASGKSRDIQVFNEDCTLGSISMTSYLFG